MPGAVGFDSPNPGPAAGREGVFPTPAEVWERQVFLNGDRRQIMKLTIERAALLKCLGHVQSVVERRNTIPILSNVKIEAGDGKLALNATDMDLDIVESVDAEVAEPGATTAPAHTLYDIVRKLPDGAQVVMEKEPEGQLVIKAGRSRFALSCLPTEDFPVLGSGELPHQFQMPVHDLNTLLDRTRFAISTEETRYYLNGIYLHETQANGMAVLRAVATDGHRLAGRYRAAARHQPEPLALSELHLHVEHLHARHGARVPLACAAFVGKRGGRAVLACAAGKRGRFAQHPTTRPSDMPADCNAAHRGNRNIPTNPHRND